MISLLAAVVLTWRLAAAAPMPCPTQAPGPGTDSARVDSVKVTTVDTNRLVISGVDLTTRQPKVLPACTGAVIEGRNGITAIRPGDLAFARELQAADGSFVATEIAINLITLNARIVDATPQNARIQALNSYDLRPVSKLYPTYHGKLPTSVQFLPNVRITGSTTSLTVSDLKAGQIIKIYGYKPPDSTTIGAFLIELVR